AITQQLWLLRRASPGLRLGFDRSACRVATPLLYVRTGPRRPSVHYLRALVDGEPRHGLLHGDHLVLLEGDPLLGFANVSGEVLPLAEAELLPPCAPSKVLGIGTNYR